MISEKMIFKSLEMVVKSGDEFIFSGDKFIDPKEKALHMTSLLATTPIQHRLRSLSFECANPWKHHKWPHSSNLESGQMQSKPLFTISQSHGVDAASEERSQMWGKHRDIFLNDRARGLILVCLCSS